MNQWGFYTGDQWCARRADADLWAAHGRAGRTSRREPVAVANSATPPTLFRTTCNVTARRRQLGCWRHGTEQIRGGVGHLHRASSYVWISNQFGNTGIDFTRIGAGFNAEQPDSVRQPTVTSRRR